MYKRSQAYANYAITIHLENTTNVYTPQIFLCVHPDKYNALKIKK